MGLVEKCSSKAKITDISEFNTFHGKNIDEFPSQLLSLEKVASLTKTSIPSFYYAKAESSFALP